MTQPEQPLATLDSLTLYRTLCDLGAEAGAVDTVIGRPEVLRSRLAALRDQVGALTASTVPPAQGAGLTEAEAWDHREWRAQLMRMVDEHWAASQAARGRTRQAIFEHATLTGPRWRAAAFLREREPASPVPPAQAPQCVECGGPVQWRCPACAINNFGPVPPAQAVPLTEEQALKLWHENAEAHKRHSAWEWFAAGIIAGERAHGITGDQHGR